MRELLIKTGKPVFAILHALLRLSLCFRFCPLPFIICYFQKSVFTFVHICVTSIGQFFVAVKLQFALLCSPLNDRGGFFCSLAKCFTFSSYENRLKAFVCMKMYYTT